MKLDTTSYYPKSPLDDDDDNREISVEAADPDVSGDASVEPPAACGSDSDAVKEPELPPSETERFIDSVAHILSIVFVPLLMPVYGIMLAFGLSILSFTGMGTRIAFTAIVFGFNVAVPAVVIGLLKRAGVVHDIGLNERKERLVPYIICIFCLVGTALFMHYKHAPMWLVMFFMGGAAAGMVEVIINRWWKISVHAAGIAGIVALLLRIFTGGICLPATFTWLIISIAAAGLLGSARIWLRRHTLWQVLAGYAVGFCAVYFMMV